MEVRYTDVDYLVFSDAASLMASGESPYRRTTYRYSSLLAFLLIPNSFLHRSWGKFIFSASGRVFQAAFWYGLVVHFRIYPIIYGLPIVLVLDPHFFISGQKPIIDCWISSHVKAAKSGKEESHPCSIRTLFETLFTIRRIKFGLVSGAVFLSWTGLFFYLYGWEFLNEALPYHLTRTDPRHNFSFYFYHIYLHYEHEFSVIEKPISFMPQLLVQLVLVFRFAQDLPFCFFLQTVAFVAFNKVITAQYFVWFFCLLLLILQWSNMKMKWEGLCCILLRMGAQTHWLLWGYLLEFKGRNVFLQLWLASLLFLPANTFVLVRFIQHQRCSSMFKQVVLPTSKHGIKSE